MDFDQQSIPISLAALLTLFIATLYFLRRRRPRPGRGGQKEAPEAPGGWPVIGHLHLFSAGELPHKTLGSMAEKYGPVFAIRMGMHQALVVTDPEVANECFTVNDKVFGSRPMSIAAVILGYNYVNFAFAPYGSYWIQLRRIIMSELLSPRRLDLLKHVRDSEIDASVKELYKVWLNQNKNGPHPVIVEMKKWFGDVILNMILRMVAGKGHSVGSRTALFMDESESERWHTAMSDFMRLIGVVTPEDAFPYLRWFDLQGYKKQMKKAIKELDSLFQGWLEEHQRQRLSGEAKGEHDFIDVLITSLENAKITYHDHDTIIKATCLSILSGGTDTTMLTLTWILSLLLNNKHTLKKAQDELDSQVGRDRQVNEIDIKNLVYIQAIVKEALRLYPAAPLSGTRQSSEDCTVAGYHVPAGTLLMVNVWKIHRDPAMWSNPLEFCPERFLTDHIDVDVKGQDYELLPFGTGRRMCPGNVFALQVMPLVVAQLLHGFDLATQNDMPVDMTETGGITNDKATPLEVVISPRLRPELYGL